MVFLGEKEIVAGNTRSCSCITSGSSTIIEGIQAHEGIEAPLIISFFLPALIHSWCSFKKELRSNASCSLMANGGMLIRGARGRVANFSGIFLCLPADARHSHSLAAFHQWTFNRFQPSFMTVLLSLMVQLQRARCYLHALGRETVKTPADSRELLRGLPKSADGVKIGTFNLSRMLKSET